MPVRRRRLGRRRDDVPAGSFAARARCQDRGRHPGANRPAPRDRPTARIGGNGRRDCRPGTGARIERQVRDAGGSLGCNATSWCDRSLASRRRRNHRSGEARSHGSQPFHCRPAPLGSADRHSRRTDARGWDRRPARHLGANLAGGANAGDRAGRAPPGSRDRRLDVDPRPPGDWRRRRSAIGGDRRQRGRPGAGARNRRHARYLGADLAGGTNASDRAGRAPPGSRDGRLDVDPRPPGDWRRRRSAIGGDRRQRGRPGAGARDRRPARHLGADLAGGTNAGDRAGRAPPGSRNGRNDVDPRAAPAWRRCRSTIGSDRRQRGRTGTRAWDRRPARHLGANLAGGANAGDRAGRAPPGSRDGRNDA